MAFVVTDYAYSQSSTCNKLERRLASISTGNSGRPSKKFRQYDRAVREQTAQMNKTKRIARNSGCTIGAFSQFGRCKRYADSLRKMRANLAQLKSVRRQLSPKKSNASAERRDILRQMKRLDCGNVRERTAALQNDRKRRSLVEQIFGMRTYDDGGNTNPQGDSYGASRGGTFRTLCVRTCDGYYFPISFSTVKERFGDDEQTCQAMCPGSETELYFHAMPSEDAEQMISYRSDRPYAEQPFAFSYRRNVNSDCKCDFKQAGIEEVAGGTDIKEVKTERELADTSAAVSLPIYRKDRNLDPESQLNLDGGFTLSAAKSLGEIVPDGNQAVADLIGKKKIRIVGPSFFPVQ